MTSIAANLQAVRARIAAACAGAGRATESVQLLAVSKTWPAASVREAIAAGQRAFGENYVQEAVTKAAELGIPALNGTSSARCKATRPGWWPKTLPGCTRWNA
jgi:uncharacterized pyridoxal phosphate-containing UPF0001 family protein